MTTLRVIALTTSRKVSMVIVERVPGWLGMSWTGSWDCLLLVVPPSWWWRWGPGHWTGRPKNKKSFFQKTLNIFAYFWSKRSHQKILEGIPYGNSYEDPGKVQLKNSCSAKIFFPAKFLQNSQTHFSELSNRKYNCTPLATPKNPLWLSYLNVRYQKPINRSVYCEPSDRLWRFLSLHRFLL